MVDLMIPKIGCGDGMGAGREGQYYVSRGPNNDRAEYLHPDGQWRGSTKTEQGWTGWYPSKAAAQAVIDKYC